MLIYWIHFLSAFWMTTIIWFVQIVHYPLFKWVPYEGRIQYSQKHQIWISFLVIPGMLMEAATLIILGRELFTHPLWIFLMVCMGCIWSSTFFIQVPCHKKLSIEPADEVIHKLVKTNWIRTILWTLKTAASAWLLIGVL